jgi:hypothetical protein
MTVQTQGYTTAGDGGGATYLLVASQAADGFGDLVMANGNVAVIQEALSASVLQFGAVGDGGSGDTDDTAAIQARLNVGGRIEFPPNRTYVLSAGLKVVNISYLWGAGELDVSRINNDNFAHGGIEINDNKNITIDGVHFTGRGNDFDVINTLQNGSGGVSIDKFTNAAVSKNIVVKNCVFDAMEYTNIFGEVRNNVDQQSGWIFRNNLMLQNAPNSNPVLAGAHESINIINTFSMDNTALHGCVIRDNVMKIFDGYDGNLFKVNGAIGAVISGNTVENHRTIPLISTSANVECILRDSVFSDNVLNIDVTNDVGGIFEGCDGLKINNCIFSNTVTIRSFLNRTDTVDQSGSNEIANCTLEKLFVRELLEAAVSFDAGNLTVSDTVISGNTTIDSVESCKIKDCKMGGVFRVEDTATSLIGTVDIESSFIASMTPKDATKITIRDTEISVLTWGTDTKMDFFNCNVKHSVSNHTTVFARFYGCDIAGLDNANVSTNVEAATGVYEDCRFWTSVGQTGGFNVVVKSNVTLRNNTYYKHLIDDTTPVALTGSVSSNGSGSELYESDSSFDNGFEEFSVFDPSDQIKKNIGIAIPTASTYQRFNRITNFNARSVGDDIGWACTTAGTPGVWNSLGKIV